MDDKTALYLVREDYDDKEYEAIETDVDGGHLKHDVTLYYCVYLRKSDNTCWQVFYECSYYDGLDASSVYAVQVEKKEVLTIEWVSVKCSSKRQDCAKRGISSDLTPGYLESIWRW